MFLIDVKKRTEQFCLLSELKGWPCVTIDFQGLFLQAQLKDRHPFLGSHELRDFSVTNMKWKSLTTLSTSLTLLQVEQ